MSLLSDGDWRRFKGTPPVPVTCTKTPKLIEPEFKFGGTVGVSADDVGDLVDGDAGAAVAAAAEVEATSTNIGEAVIRGAVGRVRITTIHNEIQLTAKKAAINPNDHSGTVSSRRVVGLVISTSN